MKNEITIPIPKEEDFVAANKRRDQYALKRDLQASEYNQAITARLLSEVKHPVKCEKCGKEFTSGTSADNASICEECR
jgi:predicted Zn-ribbon and HTH transcriptional regulator